MRSQVVFVMHPTDETEFARLVTSEPGAVFVDGPIWSTPEPRVTTDIQCCGDYLMIWSPSQTPKLTGRHYRKHDAEWWYCDNECYTIQFLRSGIQFGELFLFEGRIAVTTTDKSGTFFHEPTAHAIEQRFKNMRKSIKRSYTNNVLIWQNISLPRSKTNPIKPAANVWVGPNAINWLREEPRGRWVQQFRGAGARGYLLDLVR
jgi:hypothetical protein